MSALGKIAMAEAVSFLPKAAAQKLARKASSMEQLRSSLNNSLGRFSKTRARFLNLVMALMLHMLFAMARQAFISPRAGSSIVHFPLQGPTNHGPHTTGAKPPGRIKLRRFSIADKRESHPEARSQIWTEPLKLTPSTKSALRLLIVGAQRFLVSTLLSFLNLLMSSAVIRVIAMSGWRSSRPLPKVAKRTRRSAEPTPTCLGV